MNSRVKEVREYFGLSQVQFAEKLNMSPGAIGNIEVGRSSVSDRTISLICNAFGINRSWFCTGDGEMFAPGFAQSKADKEGACLRIKNVRKAIGLTQEQFAKSIGFSLMQVHFVEAGKTIPSNDFLSHVASVYGLSYNWLLTGEGEKKSEVKPVDEELIRWLNEHSNVLSEIRIRAGLD
jgi:transcriptional regulator with XRE-family HTH domain